MAFAHNQSGKPAAEFLGRRDGIKLVSPEGDVEQVRSLIVQRNEAIPCRQKLSDCVVSQREQLIQIRGGENAVDYFRYCASLSAGALAFGDVLMLANKV